MALDRRDVREGCAGVPLRLELELLDLARGAPLPGVTVEIWQADATGRYSGFDTFVPEPGQQVTSATVPTEVVHPAESFLRGSQATDERGRCAFDTIYPGWYASRTVHIHAVARVDGARHTTQLYFDDALTDEVFRRPPYRDRPPRDTSNENDTIYADGGERSVLEVSGDVHAGLTATACFLIDVTRPRG